MDGGKPIILKMTKGFFEKVRSAKAFLRAGRHARRYIRHQHRRLKNTHSGSDGVVLASLCPTPSVVHCYAELLPRFSKQLGARIETFQFQQKPDDPLLQLIYSSFGASAGLRMTRERSMIQKAEIRASEIFSELCTKQDVTRIHENGIRLGDLIYDTYLRDLYLPTVDIRDPRLLGYIRDALLCMYSSERYLKSHRVRAIFADHLVYIWQGVLLRVAMAQNIPIYTVYFDPRPAVHRLDLVPKEDGIEVPTRFNYWRFPQIFSRFPEERQIAAREKGLAFLRHRVSGGIQNNVLPGQSAYSDRKWVKVINESSGTKLLVLLHDFCDACHVYRDLLFDDFYEWIHFLLREASQTPFEWYLKPHPNINDYRRRGIENANQTVIEELKRTYPKIRFLDPTISNRQLIDEGISGVFTMYGTAAHEFPFLGVPAVCAADNPHVSYAFTITPGTRDEYARIIRNADTLGEVKDADRIPEFCYMNFLYSGEHLGADAAIFDPLPLPGQKPEEVWESALRAASPNTDLVLNAYVRDVLEGNTPACAM